MTIFFWEKRKSINAAFDLVHFDVFESAGPANPAGEREQQTGASPPPSLCKKRVHLRFICFPFSLNLCSYLLLLLLLFCFVILGFDPSETDNNLKINKTYNNVEEDYDRKVYISFIIIYIFPLHFFSLKTITRTRHFSLGITPSSAVSPSLTLLSHP